MATAEQVIDAARSELGYLETPVNLTKFAAEAHHLNGGAWCATFVVAIARRTGLELPSNCTSANTVVQSHGWQAAGRWHDGAEGVQPGDVVFYDFPDNTTGIEHTGIATSGLVNGLMRAVEGNTTSGVAGVQDDGGGVFERTRDASLIVGYGRPDYQTAATQEDDPMQYAAPCPWMPPNANGTEPYFVAVPESDTSFVVASIDNAPFNPPWSEDGSAAWYEDFVFLGLWWRRVKGTTGPMYGPPLVHADHVSIACAGGGVYRMAEVGP